MKLRLLFLVLAFAGTVSAQVTQSLAGEWRFALDRADAGQKENWPQRALGDRIQLPGMLTAQGFGDPISMATQWTGEIKPAWFKDPFYRQFQTPDNFKMPFWLQPPRHYVGAAWYQRDLEIPAAWAGRRITLFLERPHWETTVWLDGAWIGRGERLGTPHEFVLGRGLAAGRHTLTIRVDNRMVVNVGVNSHSVSDHTQGNWNGIVGRIELRATGPAWIEDAQVFPSARKHNARIVVEVGDASDGEIEARARAIGLQPSTPEVQARGAVRDGRAELVIDLGEQAHLWDEFSPNLYALTLTLSSSLGRDQRELRFGLRDLATDGTRFTVNGRRVFMRGTLECADFPLTGHPPMDEASWRREFATVKAYGLNHLRFHSWCPPEAAFRVADELGLYLQIEASSWANSGAQIGSGWPLDAWIEDEAADIVRRYGNHPSFAFFAYGNEPAGPNHVKWLTNFVARWKARDPRRLYTTASAYPTVLGSDYHVNGTPRIQHWSAGLKSLINAQPPRSDYDWSDWVKKHPDAPTISHEIGQWCVYPNFAEMAKYTGFMQPKNYEVFREQAGRNGVLAQAHEFFLASGKLQALCYKADIEAALRTPGFGGFQLLGLSDFSGQGTALVGVLDAFWEPKDYLTADDYRRFAGPIVPLARLPKMLFTAGEKFSAEIELAQFGAHDLAGPVAWRVRDAAGQTIAEGKLGVGGMLRAGELIQVGRVELTLADGPARKLILEVSVADTDARNAWDFWAYPAQPDLGVPADVRVVTTLDPAAEAHLRAGGKVLWLAPADRLQVDPHYGPVKLGFSSIFWNTAWTSGQAPHTLGILCDPKHAALADFPTEFHSNWQWWELVHDAAPFIVTPQRALRPIVQIVDDWVTARKLALVFEAKVGVGKLVACSADLSSDLERRPVARQLRASLLRYMEGGAFAPTTAMSLDELRGLVRPGRAPTELP